MCGGFFLLKGLGIKGLMPAAQGWQKSAPAMGGIRQAPVKFAAVIEIPDGLIQFGPVFKRNQDALRTATTYFVGGAGAGQADRPGFARSRSAGSET